MVIVLMKQSKKRVRVTKRVIEEAISRRDEDTSIYTRCVITIALQKAFKTVDVITQILIAFVNGQRIVLPQSAVDITSRSSHHWEQVKPFSFTVNI